MADHVHRFSALAFVENFSLKEVAAVFPEARLSSHELYLAAPANGGMYVYPFGAVVTLDLAPEVRDAQIARLQRSYPGLAAQVVREEYSVVENPESATGLYSGVLRVDRLTSARAGVVALTVAQSAAMEYYERIVEQLFSRTRALSDRLERRGTVPFRTRQLHRFIGEAIATRTEVLSILHLLDKPDATWDDPAMDRIYDELRAEFDLIDRYAALESKLRSIQEALELVLDVARDRRLIFLEVVIVALFLVEIALSITRLH